MAIIKNKLSFFIKKRQRLHRFIVIISSLIIFSVGIMISHNISKLIEPQFILAKNNVVSDPHPPKEWDTILGVYDSHLDHQIFYNNFYDILKSARDADILVLGNSQTLFGLDYKSFEPFLKKHNLRLFNMAFGHDENYKFPLKIIEKYNLRPKYILADAWIFKRPSVSPFGSLVLNMSKFDAFKDVFESTISYKVNLLIHQILPKISFIEPQKKKIVIMRSKTNGSYYLHPISAVPTSTIDTVSKNPYQVELYLYEDITQLNQAREFKKLVDRIGAELILYTIPGRGYMPYRPFVQTLADKIQAHAALPEINTGSSFDGRHLSEPAAVFFTKKLTEEIERQGIIQSKF